MNGSAIEHLIGNAINCINGDIRCGAGILNGLIVSAGERSNSGQLAGHFVLCYVGCTS